jgi:hypothetical protein
VVPVFGVPTMKKSGLLMRETSKVAGGADDMDIDIKDY